METKSMFGVFLGFCSLIAVVPAVHGQDLSRYREFVLGENLTTVLKLTDQKLTDVSQTLGSSPMLQELTWWPPSASGRPYRSDSVEQILFSFCDGALYKITVTYDQNSTEGLTAKDMVKSISEKYGPPTAVSPDVATTVNSHYEAREKSVAEWEDSQRSLSLVLSSFSSRFGLVMYTKRVNAEVESAIKEAAIRELLDGPAKEAALKKKRTDDLEVARQKNQKSFRP